MKFSPKDKFRVFRFLAYGEEIEEARKELLGDMVKFCMIVHEPESDEGKEHAHFMIDYGNTTTLNHIKKSWGHLAANEYIEPCLYPDNSYKYLYHDQSIEASKGKKVYPESAVEKFNGFDPAEIRTWTETEKLLLMDCVMEICNREGIDEYSGLLEYLSKENRQIYAFACNHTVLVNAYTTSARHRGKKRQKAVNGVDSDGVVHPEGLAGKTITREKGPQ